MDATTSGNTLTYTSTARKVAQQVFYPNVKNCYIEGSYIFGIPKNLPVNGVIHEITLGTPFYIGTLIFYNFNMQDYLNISTFNQSNIGYYVFLQYMCAGQTGAIHLDISDGVPYFGLKNIQGNNSIASISNIILSVSSYNRQENPTQ